MQRHFCALFLFYRCIFLTSHGNFSFLLRLKQLFERIIVLIKSCVFDSDDKVEKCLKTGFWAWRIVLDLQVDGAKYTRWWCGQNKQKLSFTVKSDENLFTLNTWYPSVPPPGISTLCEPPMTCLSHNQKKYLIDTNQKIWEQTDRQIIWKWKSRWFMVQ